MTELNSFSSGNVSFRCLKNVCICEFTLNVKTLKKDMCFSGSVKLSKTTCMKSDTDNYFAQYNLLFENKKAVHDYHICQQTLGFVKLYLSPKSIQMAGKYRLLYLARS